MIDKRERNKLAQRKFKANLTPERREELLRKKREWFKKATEKDPEKIRNYSRKYLAKLTPKQRERRRKQILQYHRDNKYRCSVRNFAVPEARKLGISTKEYLLKHGYGEECLLDKEKLEN